ncbi:uncharacterized mitochondrial protein-like protein [Tanacetum coccineum]
MKPPPKVPHQSGEVCKLRKALYGLKHAPHAWYEKFSIVVTSLGFVCSHHDPALFVKRSSVGHLGLLCYFLGIEVASSLKGYLLSQSKYIVDLFDRAIIIDNKINDILIDAKARYTLTNGDPLPDPTLYRTIVREFGSSYSDSQILLILSTLLVNLLLLQLCDSVTRKSTTGFCVFLGDSLIS